MEFMVINVDLEKAYDCLKWKFMKNTLYDAKMRQILINVIEQCVSSSYMQVLWNGSPTDHFDMSRGVR